MIATIDLDRIIAEARKSQESPQDISFPFYRAFHDLYPEAGDYLYQQLTNEVTE
jgi:hypothetical protein